MAFKGESSQREEEETKRRDRQTQDYVIGALDREAGSDESSVQTTALLDTALINNLMESETFKKRLTAGRRKEEQKIK